LPLYTKLFAELGWLAAVGAVVAILLLPLMGRLSRAHQQCAEPARSGEGVAASVQ
jgi:POT family proton-dependent oligopeptide transporter